MGKIKRGILGGFSGKVANVVGSSWKGIAVIKSLPLSVANPRTIAQREQRRKFKNVALIAKGLLIGVIHPIWNKFAQQMSGYNLFIQQLIEEMNEDGTIILDSFYVSQGSIEAVDILSATLLPVGGMVSVDWPNNTLPSGASMTDIMGLAVVAKNGEGAICTTNAETTRADGFIKQKVDDFMAKYGEIEVYLYCMSEDGSKSSGSTHATPEA